MSKKKTSNSVELVTSGKLSKDRDETIKEIEVLHFKFLENARNHLLLAKQIGERLEEKKTTVKHGEWEAWVEANLPFKIRTAQYYMKIHKNWNTLITSSAKSIGLLTEAIELITEKKSLQNLEIAEKLKLEKREKRQDILSLHRRFFKKGENLNQRDRKAIYHFLEDIRVKREEKLKGYQTKIEKTKQALTENKKQMRKVLESLKE
ncbi:MAG TPA: DUF3102 domain-containing protein [Leptospiraceae bacterium]|nr:DUF3102 domain-containing protein [Leptospiraceae bacterium]HMW05357.1 DUF3102 domain-containing protein [Leptospiraceae bacterium]HMX34344.1 DUF3102 domain-containing protein [Leptospiraceae bacterium]HMY31552.1 DUF3102 domain-containing protein [Leptospiraceae bacterium]HMZ66981.1 DUF3102 domain-containing protein [Leptospiraceae bacterium]